MNIDNEKKRGHKVLIVTSSFPCTPLWVDGGFIWKKSVSLQRNGISVIVLCPHGPGAPRFEEDEGVCIYRFPYLIPFRAQKLAGRKGLCHEIRKRPIVALSFLPFLISCIIHAIILAIKYRPDVIHSHWIIPNGIVGACIHFIFKIPHISSVHGTDVTISADNHIFSRFIRIIAKNTQSITTNSSFTSQMLSEILPDYGPFKIIPMGIHCEPEKGTNNVSKKNPHLVLYVGRLIDWKGVHILISSMKTVIQMYNTAHLVIVGDGPLKKNLICQVKELGLEEYVTFTGQVPDRILQDYYSQAAVFVLPSITVHNQTEGLGVVLLEAMAAGVPVIGSKTGGIPDIIQHGDNGLLFPPGGEAELATTIMRIFSDTTLADKLRDGGLKTLKDRFSWDGITREFIQEYQKIIQAKKGIFSSDK